MTTMISSALFKLVTPSIPNIPSVPSLAELQKHSEALTASLPTYSSFSGPTSSVPVTNDDSVIKQSKPIPMVNITTQNPTPPVQDSWLSRASWGYMGNNGTNTPPPSYASHDLRSENIKDRAGDRSVPGQVQVQVQDVDQGREGLRGMRTGGRRVQGGIPGEASSGVERKGKWGNGKGVKNQPMIGEVGEDGMIARPESNLWVRWVRCGA